MLLLLLAFLTSSFLASFSSSAAAANVSYTTLLRRSCGGPQAANPQSFDVNFVNSMEMVSREIADSYFGISVSGKNASDRVYGLGQCLNYLSNTDCRLCYAESRVKVPLCLPAISGRVNLYGCFLRYGNYNFSQVPVDESDSSICESSGNVGDLDKFKSITTELIRNLSLGAYEERDFYKELNASLLPGVTVYGVAQCWRSLNKSGCRVCLESARNRTVGCLPASDGKALNTGCILQYSLEPFRVRESSDGGSSSIARRMGVAFGCLFAAMTVIGAAILFRRLRSVGNDDFSETNDSSRILKSISESHLSFMYEELRQATNDFHEENKIGQGGYGSVYKGILSDGREIAVKRLFINTTQWLDQFFNEVNLISQVQHKNLVKLHGCSVDGPESLLVYEYLCNISVDRFLFDSFRKKALDWGKRMDILVGTAEGLAYLHKSSEIRIIHRDIKTSNVLLDEKLKPKIADFGLARYFAEGQSHLSTGVAGTLGYMAPEYIIHGQLTEKADVYSYGVLVLEVLTGLRNTSAVSSSSESHSLISQVWINFGSDNLMEVLDADVKGQCREEEALHVFRVGLLCTQASPNLRPPMWKVVEMLSNDTKEIPLPTQPPFINTKGLELRSSGSESSKFSSSSKYPESTNQLSLSIVRGR